MRTFAIFLIAGALPCASLAEGTREESGYVVGPGDQLTFHVVDVPEIGEKPVPVDGSGFVHLALAGRIKAAGLTVAEMEAEVGERLRGYLLHPDVSVSVAEFRSQPVSIIGAVKNPGVQQLQGRKTLIEMLSLAGGLDATAGPTVKIARRLEWGKIPLDRAVSDSTGQFSVAEVSVKSILGAKNPDENILIKPQDVISVPRAEIVFVIGQVLKPGEFVMHDHERVTALQALSMAGGLDHTAKPEHARILRQVRGAASQTEVPIDLKKIMAGKAPDLPLQSDDILFVPSNTSEKVALRALEAAIQTGTGIAIWRR